MLALVEGWVEHVVTEALGERIPSTKAMNEAWSHRRSTGGSAEKAFSQVVGIELNAPKVDAAAELWRRATVAVGVDKRDSAWDHPDLLPTAEHIDNPASFIDGLLDDSTDEGFEEEFSKLEEMLKQQSDSDAGDADAAEASGTADQDSGQSEEPSKSDEDAGEDEGEEPRDS